MSKGVMVDRQCETAKAHPLLCTGVGLQLSR